MFRKSTLFISFLAILISLPAYSLKIKKNQPFPEFKLPYLVEEGRTPASVGKDKSFLSNADFKGKVVIVDFWASWCGPCKQELPALNSLYKKYQGKGLVVVGFNLDDKKDDALKFVQEQKVDFPLVYDQQKTFASKLGISTMPSSFILDKKGQVAFVQKGFQMDDVAVIEKEIKRLLQ